MAITGMGCRDVRPGRLYIGWAGGLHIIESAWHPYIGSAGGLYIIVSAGGMYMKIVPGKPLPPTNSVYPIEATISRFLPILGSCHFS